MLKKEKYSSGTVWEKNVGYSRAVKVGNIIEVSGTTAVNENGEIVGLDDAYQQACFIFQKIRMVLNIAGADLKDVVRTRMYVTDISHWEDVGRAHGEFFRKIKPAATLIEVNALVDPLLLVEIEATAIIGE